MPCTHRNSRSAVGLGYSGGPWPFPDRTRGTGPFSTGPEASGMPRSSSLKTQHDWVEVEKQAAALRQKYSGSIRPGMNLRRAVDRLRYVSWLASSPASSFQRKKKGRCAERLLLSCSSSYSFCFMSHKLRTPLVGTKTVRQVPPRRPGSQSPTMPWRVRRSFTRATPRGLFGEHGPDGGPFVVGKFIAHDSKRPPWELE